MTQEFKDWYQGLQREPNVRVVFKEIFLRTKTTIETERKLSLEVVLLIAHLDRDNGPANLGFSSTAELARALGLTENMYWKRAQVGRVASFFPEVWEMLSQCETQVARLERARGSEEDKV